MNNKDFIAEVARRSGMTSKDALSLLATLVSEVSDKLENGNIISVQNIGTFEVKKKQERVVTNPSTMQRMLVPPKLIINFKPASALKEKMQ